MCLSGAALVAGSFLPSVGEFSACYFFIAGSGLGNRIFSRRGSDAAPACGLFLVSRMLMVMALGYCMTNGLLSSSCPGSVGKLVDPKHRDSRWKGGLVLGLCLQAFQFAAIGSGRRSCSGATAWGPGCAPALATMTRDSWNQEVFQLWVCRRLS